MSTPKLTSTIYLDHAAASPLRPAVLAAMTPYLTGNFANPGSLARDGVAARAAIEQARATIADTLGAHPDEIIMTSGGTESTNLALQGILLAGQPGQIVTTAIEHHAVLEPCQLLAQSGWTLTVVGVPRAGVIDPAAVKACLTSTTRLVSIMLANNEIGTIQPIREIARLLYRMNRQRSRENVPPIYLHTDACQAGSYLSLKVDDLRVDALSLNGAKLGGPKASGVLYLRRGTPLRPLLVGGGQEAGRRAGTENVAAIVGLATAFHIAQADCDREAARLRTLRDRLWHRLQQAFPDIWLNGDPEHRLPSNLNITIPGLDAEELLLYLDADSVTIGTGAACSTLTLEPSHVLKAIGLSNQEALATIRLTLGATTTARDIDTAAHRIIKKITWLRSPHHVSRSD